MQMSPTFDKQNAPSTVCSWVLERLIHFLAALLSLRIRNRPSTWDTDNVCYRHICPIILQLSSTPPLIISPYTITLTRTTRSCWHVFSWRTSTRPVEVWNVALPTFTNGARNEDYSWTPKKLNWSGLVVVRSWRVYRRWTLQFVSGKWTWSLSIVSVTSASYWTAHWACISTSPEWHQPVSFISGGSASLATYSTWKPGSDLSASTIVILRSPVYQTPHWRCCNEYSTRRPDLNIIVMTAKYLAFALNSETRLC